jgi:Chalcone isomerase-like
MKVRRLITPAAFWCAVALSLAADDAREESGVSMPEMVGVDGREIQLNGIGVFKKAFVKIYVAGLYLEVPTQRLMPLRPSALSSCCCATSAAKRLFKP